MCLHHAAFEQQVSTLCFFLHMLTLILLFRLIGRWRSDEMLHYLHVQAAPLMVADYSRRMLESGQYTLIPNQMVPIH